MKPDFVTEEQWNAVNPTKRESIVALAATLFRMGFSNQQSFIYANEIDKAQALIKKSHFNFEKLYKDWSELGFHPLASDLLQTLLFGKLFKSVILAAHENYTDIINAEKPVREAWKHIDWDFPKEYCPCCFSKEQSNDPVIIKNDFMVHTRCINLYPEIIKYLCNLCAEEAKHYQENKDKINETGTPPAPDHSQEEVTEGIVEHVEEVDFEDLLPEEINFLDAF